MIRENPASRFFGSTITVGVCWMVLYSLQLYLLTDLLTYLLNYLLTTYLLYLLTYNACLTEHRSSTRPIGETCSPTSRERRHEDGLAVLPAAPVLRLVPWIRLRGGELAGLSRGVWRPRSGEATADERASQRCVGWAVPRCGRVPARVEGALSRLRAARRRCRADGQRLDRSQRRCRCRMVAPLHRRCPDLAVKG